MKWIQTGRQLGKGVRNVQRLGQIASVLIRHGFADVVDRLDLGKYLPQPLARMARNAGDKTIPERLRSAFEELGPTFVKLGQLLSTRPDLFPENFIEEFRQLQDNVQPITFEEVKAVIEAELGQKIERTFQWINPQPLASASISQVHEARLYNGDSVVLKVQRPEIEKTIRNDISLISMLAQILENRFPETKIVSPTTIVDEFFKTLSFELDFHIEANNMKRMTENLKEFHDVVIPKVYKTLSSRRVLTLEKIEGIRVNDVRKIDEAGIDRKKLVELGARAFFKSILIDGLFHGDLHGGNLFALAGGKMGLVDFGIVGRLSEKARDQLAQMVLSLLNEDYEHLCYQYADLGSVTPTVDFESFQREVRNSLSPYLGLNLSEVNTGKVLIEATKIAAKYKIRVPGDWMIVFKSIFTVEGMGRTLYPDFDFFSVGHDLVRDLVKNQYSMHRLSKEALWIAKDLSALLQVLPRQFKWMFRKFQQNEYAIEIRSPDIRDMTQELKSNNRRLGFALIGSSLCVAASILMHVSTPHLVLGYPTLGIVLLSSGIYFLLRFLFF